MATVSYTIYSHYDPQAENNTPKCDTSSSTTDPDPASWDFDSKFKPPPALPPRFVPATFTAPDWASENILAKSYDRRETPVANDVSNWYRSMTNGRSVNESHVQPRPPSLSREKQDSQPQSTEKKDKNNWFIFNAIQSNPEVHPNGKASPSTLAAMIARDPPPLPDEEQFKPPVWLEIGPSNKGFAMLQRSGWSEGEPLGPDVTRRLHLTSDADLVDAGKRKEKHISVKQEIMEVDMEGYDDVSELRQVDVIDLTTEDDDDSVPPTSNAEPQTYLAKPPPKPFDDDHGRTALLTPIPTVLKSDRLGIGLKAKTVGPYKVSQKRVTHNAAALAAHIRSAAENRQKKKLFGRGSRGFHVQQKTDESDRKRLLAYLND